MKRIRPGDRIALVQDHECFRDFFLEALNKINPSHRWNVRRYDELKDLSESYRKEDNFSLILGVALEKKVSDKIQSISEVAK
jgi:hypothetical protein